MPAKKQVPRGALAGRRLPVPGRESTVVSNLDECLLVIGEDRLRLCIAAHREQIDARQAWVTPATALFTLLLTMTTASPHHAFGLTADTWWAVWTLGAIASCVWLVRSLRRAHRAPTVDELVRTMHGGASSTTTTALADARAARGSTSS
jgi:uncharacterized ParB-like nuclease family protein